MRHKSAMLAVIFLVQFAFSAAAPSKTKLTKTRRSIKHSIKYDRCGPIIPTEQGRYVLTSRGICNWDVQRPLPEEIDTIVIHHTDMLSGVSADKLSRIQKKTVYKIRPHSGHYLDGRHRREIFYAYHWIVRQNGSFERLLGDRQIGWHAHNWEVNRRSIAIVLDGSFEANDPAESVRPSQQMLDAVLQIIKQYPNIKYVVGHRDVWGDTKCPGEWIKDFEFQLQEAGYKTELDYLTSSNLSAVR